MRVADKAGTVGITSGGVGTSLSNERSLNGVNDQGPATGWLLAPELCWASVCS